MSSARAATTGHPSLRRTTVLAFGEQRARDSEPRVNQPEPPRASVLPDDEHVWLDTATVAIMLAISDSPVRQLARRGSMPCTTRGRRRWFRRDHVEVIAAARAARQSHALSG